MPKGREGTSQPKSIPGKRINTCRGSEWGVEGQCTSGLGEDEGHYYHGHCHHQQPSPMERRYGAVWVDHVIVSYGTGVAGRQGQCGRPLRRGWGSAGRRVGVRWGPWGEGVGEEERSRCINTVLGSQGCHKKLPQMRWLKTVAMYSLTIWEARNPKSKCWQGTLPLKALGRKTSLPLSSFWWLLALFGLPWLVAASLQPLLHHYTAFFPLYVSTRAASKDTSHWTWGSTYPSTTSS